MTELALVDPAELAVVDRYAAMNILAGRVAAAFLDDYSAGNTRAAYRRDLKDFAEFIADRDWQPLAIRREQVAKYARDLERRGKSPATVARHLSVLSKFYNYAEGEDLIDRNPVKHVRRPKVSIHSTTLGLDEGEAVRFLVAASAAGPRDHALACLLLLNALRVSEVVAADADQLADEDGHRVIAVKEKGGGRRLLPLAAPTVRAVEGHLGGRTSGPLLAAEMGGRLHRQQVARVVARLARTIGVTKTITPHSLRHTAITLALKDGTPIREVQVSVGHVDPKTTIRYDRARRDLAAHITYRLARMLAE